MNDTNTPKPPKKKSPSVIHRQAMHDAFKAWMNKPSEHRARMLADKMTAHEIKMRLAGQGGNYLEEF